MVATENCDKYDDRLYAEVTEDKMVILAKSVPNIDIIVFIVKLLKIFLIEEMVKKCVLGLLLIDLSISILLTISRLALVSRLRGS